MSNAVLDEVLANRPEGPSLGDYAATLDELAAAERRRDEQLAHARSILDRSLDAPAQLRKAWQQLIRLPLPAVYQMRDRFEGAFRAQLDTIAVTTQILPLAELLAGHPLPGAEKLPATRADLTTFAERILSHWTSEDELAEIAVETFELPEWVLKGPNPPGVGFPQHWIDDVDDDPFQPLPDVP